MSDPSPSIEELKKQFMDCAQKIINGLATNQLKISEITISNNKISNIQTVTMTEDEIKSFKNKDKEGNDTQNQEKNDTQNQEGNDTQNQEGNDTHQEGNDTQNQKESNTQNQEGNNTQNQEGNDTQNQEGNDTHQEGNDTQNQKESNTQNQEGNNTQNQEGNDTQNQEGNDTQNQEESDNQDQKGGAYSTTSINFSETSVNSSFLNRRVNKNVRNMYGGSSFESDTLASITEVRNMPRYKSSNSQKGGGNMSHSEFKKKMADMGITSSTSADFCG